MVIGRAVYNVDVDNLKLVKVKVKVNSFALDFKVLFKKMLCSQMLGCVH